MFYGGSGKRETDRFITEGQASHGQYKILLQGIRVDNQNLKQKGGESMLSQCTLTGNLGGDPEVFYSSERRLNLS